MSAHAWSRDRLRSASAADPEEEGLHRQERIYRNDQPPPDIPGRIVFLVDGLATPSTMRAAALWP
jgi:predicted phosphoribosyltransferase